MRRRDYSGTTNPVSWAHSKYGEETVGHSGTTGPAAWAHSKYGGGTEGPVWNHKPSILGPL